MSESSAAKETPKERQRAVLVRQRCGRFRTLVIGRANAGKTTILQKVCNTTEQAQIFDADGNRVC